MGERTEAIRAALEDAATLCSCGHRLGIHEYPMRCNGAESWPDDNVTRCECWHEFTYQQIAADRERLAAEEVPDHGEEELPGRPVVLVNGRQIR